MYSINENLPKTKLVKIATKNSKTKKKKYQVEEQDIDYLKQVIRNKNKEVKIGGGKMEKLLQSNQEIEALLNRKKTRKQTKNNPKNKEQQNIENLLHNKNAMNKTCQEPPQDFKIEEVDLSSHTAESNKPRPSQNRNNNSTTSRKEKNIPSNKPNSNTNFLAKIIKQQKKSESNQNQLPKSKKTFANASTQTNIRGVNKPVESRNGSNIDLSTSGVKMKSKSKGKSKISSAKKPPPKKTKKKEFPKELTKLSKKHTTFIEQLLKPNPQMKVKKSVKNKNLKNLKLDSSSINLSSSTKNKSKTKVPKKAPKSSTSKQLKQAKKSKKKIISANLKPPSPKRLKKKSPEKKKTEKKSPEKETPRTLEPPEELENPYQSVMEKLIQDKKAGKKFLKIKELSKADLKKKLIELELIKPDSKAPIKVLRDIYFFYDITRMKLQK